MHPRVSVIIPTFNRERTIRSSIDSVLRQTYSEFELIVVDDCSTDNTRSILATIDDPRIRLICHDRNRGPSEARNTGTRAASGEWLAFQDSDDEWLPTKLELQMARLNGHTYVAVYCGVLIFGLWDPSAGGRPSAMYFPNPEMPLPDGDILPMLLKDSFISTQTLVVRRDVFEAEDLFDPSMPPLEDWDLALRLARRGQIAFVDQPLVIQHFSPDSITRSRLKAVTAKSRIVEKNLDLLVSRPRVLSHHYHNIGGAWRDLREYGKARQYLLKALRLSPLAPRSLLSLGYTLWLDFRQKISTTR